MHKKKRYRDKQKPNANSVGAEQRGDLPGRQKPEKLAKIKEGLNWTWGVVAWPIVYFLGLNSVERFTVVLFVMATFLGWAFIQSERSSLVISDIRLTDAGVVPGKRPAIIIEIKNPSKSTAFIEEFNSFGGDGPNIPPADAVQLEPGSMHPPVAPNVPVHIEIDMPMEFPQDIIDLMDRGKYHIWVIGTVKYGDRFRWFGGGETGFCFFFDPSRGRGVDSFYRCHNSKYEYAN